MFKRNEERMNLRGQMLVRLLWALLGGLMPSWYDEVRNGLTLRLCCGMGAVAFDVDVWHLVGVTEVSELGEQFGSRKWHMDRCRERRSSSCEVSSGESFIFSLESCTSHWDRQWWTHFWSSLSPCSCRHKYSPQCFYNTEESDFMTFLFWLFLWRVLSKHRSKNQKAPGELWVSTPYCAL